MTQDKRHVFEDHLRKLDAVYRQLDSCCKALNSELPGVISLSEYPEECIQEILSAVKSINGCNKQLKSCAFKAKDAMDILGKSQEQLDYEEKRDSLRSHLEGLDDKK